jgi:hypothetical protein
MKALEPQGLSMQRWARRWRALFRLGLVWFWAAACSVTVAQHKAGFAGYDWILAAGFGVVLNTWGLARAVRNGHFLWLYSRWQAQAGGGLALQHARQAYRDGDLERVILLAGKEGEPGEAASLREGAARSLALLGRMEEAAVAFEAVGAKEPLRWLRPRRAWGLSLKPYFRVADAAWSRRGVWLVALAAISVLGVGTYLSAVGDLGMHAPGRSFNSADFEALERSAFTVHYHDRAAGEALADLAEKALVTELAFLGRSDAEIPPGSFQLFLCDSREEYLKRAPQAPAWEQAATQPESGTIYLHKLPEDERVYFEIVVAHELSHLLYHRFFPVPYNDAWLNEGLADYQGYAFALDRAGVARQAWLRQKRFAKLAERSLPFDRYFLTDPHELKSDADVETFYRQGFSLVFLLVEHYGQKNFLRFLDAYREQRGNATKALAQVYPTIQDESELAAVWGLFYEKGL